MRKAFQLIICLGIILASQPLFGQNGTVRGILTDKNSGEPLMFANISLKNSSVKSISDEAGTFLLEHLANGKHTIVCSYPGYESKEVNLQITDDEPKEVKIILTPRKLAFTTASSSVSTETH